VDAYAESSGAVRETMLHHLTNFMNQKFGLKKLCVEWQAGLMTALANFESVDAHVKLFRKVGRHAHINLRIWLSVQKL
jgi:hypothetical protein